MGLAAVVLVEGDRMRYPYGKVLRAVWKYLCAYFKIVLKWLVLAGVIGGLSGVIGALFHHGVDVATALRGEYPWLLWCLPLAGLVIVGIYKVTRTEGMGTNDVFDAIRDGRPLFIGLLPAIFFSTVLTHLSGGSAGREGAALQMGGTLGYNTGRLFRLDDRDLRTAVMAGMAAFFTALFGTPVTAAVFSVAIVTVGQIHHAALIPCLTAALTAYQVAHLMDVSPTRFTVAVPHVTPALMISTAILAALCAVLSVAFCHTIHFMGHWFSKRIPNPWLRIAAGGGIVAAVSLLLGTADYNGAGMNIIADAVERGSARPEAFILKLLFTAVTLGAGYKGGEVVPSFFVGATFGCVVGPLVGIPSGFAAAVGMVSVFCGAANCPLASIFLAVELFGDEGLLCYALACAISYALSGYSSLYSSQHILYSKLKDTFEEPDPAPHDVEADAESGLLQEAGKEA